MEHEKDKTITADGDAVKASPRQHVALGELTKKKKTVSPRAYLKEFSVSFISAPRGQFSGSYVIR